MTDIYQETESYDAPVYDDYYPHETEYEDEFYEDDYPEEEFVYEDESEEAFAHAVTGKRRVMRLLLILALVLLIIGVLVFGVIPYVDAMSQGAAPMLPPAVQT